MASLSHLAFSKDPSTHSHSSVPPDLPMDSTMTGQAVEAPAADEGCPHHHLHKSRGCVVSPHPQLCLWWRLNRGHLPILDHALGILVEGLSENTSSSQKWSNAGLHSVGQAFADRGFPLPPTGASRLQLQPYLGTGGQPPGQSWAPATWPSAAVYGSGPMSMAQGDAVLLARQPTELQAQLQLNFSTSKSPGTSSLELNDQVQPSCPF